MDLRYSSDDEVEYETPEDHDPGRFHLLVIGIGEYDNFKKKPTPGAVKGAKAIKSLLKLKYGFSEIQTIESAEATATGIKLAIEAYIDDDPEDHTIRDKQEAQIKLGATDNLLIWFSGHGGKSKKADLTFFIPKDGQTDERGNPQHNWISHEDFRKLLENIKARKVLVISDSCFSGGILNPRDTGFNKTLDDLHVIPELNTIARQAVSSCNKQLTYDTGIKGHSFFTGYLIETLINNIHPATTTDQIITDVKKLIYDHGNLPRPRIGEFQAGYKGQFIFFNHLDEELPPDSAFWEKITNSPCIEDLEFFIDFFSLSEHYAEANYQLGLLYKNSENLDDALARIYTAAVCGHGAAIQTLSKLYEAGDGVLENKQIASFLRNQAIASEVEFFPEHSSAVAPEQKFVDIYPIEEKPEPSPEESDEPIAEPAIAAVSDPNLYISGKHEFNEPVEDGSGSSSSQPVEHTERSENTETPKYGIRDKNIGNPQNWLKKNRAASALMLMLILAPIAVPVATKIIEKTQYKQAKNDAIASNTIEGYEQFKANHPDGEEFANQQISELITERSKEKDRLAYDAAKNSNTREAFEAYLRKHPTGQFRTAATKEVNEFKSEEEAQKKKDQIRKDNQAFKEAKATNSSTAYRNYLSSFPQGLHVAEARKLLTVALDKEMFVTAKASHSIGMLREYTIAFPKGLNLEEAENLAWNIAKTKNNSTEYRKFIKHFGNSRYFEEAKSALDTTLAFEGFKRAKHASEYPISYSDQKEIKSFLETHPQFKRELMNLIRSDILSQTLTPTSNLLHGQMMSYMDFFSDYSLLDEYFAIDVILKKPSLYIYNKSDRTIDELTPLAINGDLVAQTELAFELGPIKGRDWFEKAAKQGSGIDKYRYAASILSAGVISKEDISKAKKWLNLALDAGYSDAILDIRRLELFDISTRQNALNELEKLATQDTQINELKRNANLLLGAIHYSDMFSKKDLKLAKKFLVESTKGIGSHEQNVAFYLLATLYATDNEDPQQTAYWISYIDLENNSSTNTLLIKKYGLNFLNAKLPDFHIDDTQSSTDAINRGYENVVIGEYALRDDRTVIHVTTGKVLGTLDENDQIIDDQNRIIGRWHRSIGTNQ